MLFAAAYAWFGIALEWNAMGFGALGWLIALSLRGPVAMLATKLSGTPERAKLWVGGASGPLEEGVRLAVLAFSSIGFTLLLAAHPLFLLFNIPASRDSGVLPWS